MSRLKSESIFRGSRLFSRICEDLIGRPKPGPIFIHCSRRRGAQEEGPR